MNQKTEPINIKTSEVSHKKPIRKILTGFVTLLSTLLFTVIIGVYIPKIPYIGEVGTALVTYFVLQFLLLSLIVGGLAYLSWRLGGKRMAVIAIVLSIVNIIGYTIPFVSLLNTAKENGVNISLSRSLTGEMEVGGPELHKSVKFASLDGTDLYMDITKPENWEGKSSLTPVVLIHGGGFVSGTRGMNHGWTNFYTNRGYVVFDVEYRLSTKEYHTWNKSAVDVVTAIEWIWNHSDEFEVDLNKVIISGNSAGGGLALHVGYGIQEGTLKFSNPEIVVNPQAVVAIYPGFDLKTIWEDNTRALSTIGRKVCEYYIGGSPTEFPKEYAAVNAMNYITEETPPTIIISAKNDHLVPYRGHIALADALTESERPNVLVSLPFTEHGFDLFPDDIASQIAYKSATKFLDQYIE